MFVSSVSRNFDPADFEKLSSELKPGKLLSRNYTIDDKPSKSKVIFLSIVTFGIYYFVHKNTYSYDKIVKQINSDLKTTLNQLLNKTDNLNKPVNGGFNFSFDLDLEIESKTDLKETLDKYKEAIDLLQDKKPEDKVFSNDVDGNIILKNNYEQLIQHKKVSKRVNINSVINNAILDHAKKKLDSRSTSDKDLLYGNIIIDLVNKKEFYPSNVLDIQFDENLKKIFVKVIDSITYLNGHDIQVTKPVKVKFKVESNQDRENILIENSFLDGRLVDQEGTRQIIQKAISDHVHKNIVKNGFLNNYEDELTLEVPYWEKTFPSEISWEIEASKELSLLCDLSIELTKEELLKDLQEEVTYIENRLQELQSKKPADPITDFFDQKTKIKAGISKLLEALHGRVNVNPDKRLNTLKIINDIFTVFETEAQKVQALSHNITKI